jgi:SAM-dependent methyltransferase
MPHHLERVEGVGCFFGIDEAKSTRPLPREPVRSFRSRVLAMSDPSVAEATKRFYDTVARRNPEVPFLNYGFMETDAPAEPASLDLGRVCRRLYEEVLMPFPESSRVLEVGCGRGGGAAFLLEGRPGLAYVGLDLSGEHARVCRRRFTSNRAAQFAVADATQLPVADGRFDAAFSVEAAHHFADIHRFYREVARALRPGGWLMLTGLWRPSQSSNAPFEAAGFRVVERHDITANVVASLDRTSPLRLQMIEALDLPDRFKPLLLSWAGVRGYAAYDSLASRSQLYLRFRLQRE